MAFMFVWFIKEEEKDWERGISGSNHIYFDFIWYNLIEVNDKYLFLFRSIQK